MEGLFVTSHRGRDNKHRVGTDLPQLQPGESPGLIFFLYGKNKDGHWDGAVFQRQCVDIIDVIEVIYPNI